MYIDELQLHNCPKTMSSLIVTFTHVVVGGGDGGGVVVIVVVVIVISWLVRKLIILKFRLDHSVTTCNLLSKTTTGSRQNTLIAGWHIILCTIVLNHTMYHTPIHELDPRPQPEYKYILGMLIMQAIHSLLIVHVFSYTSALEYCFSIVVQFKHTNSISSSLSIHNVIGGSALFIFLCRLQKAINMS